MIIKGQEEKEIIELMRGIKNNKPSEYLNLIRSMKLLRDMEVNKTEQTMEQAILKLLDIQSKILNKDNIDQPVNELIIELLHIQNKLTNKSKKNKKEIL